MDRKVIVDFVNLMRLMNSQHRLIMPVPKKDNKRDFWLTMYVRLFEDNIELLETVLKHPVRQFNQRYKTRSGFFLAHSVRIYGIESVEWLKLLKPYLYRSTQHSIDNLLKGWTPPLFPWRKTIIQLDYIKSIAPLFDNLDDELDPMPKPDHVPGMW